MPAASNRRSFDRRSLHSARGSVLIVSLLLAAIIAISLTSYLKMSTSAFNLAQRNFLDNSAMNLAEVGLERALYCFNQVQASGVATATAWSAWTTDTTAHTAKLTVSGFTPIPGATGIVKVYVLNYDLNGAPVVTAQSTITPASGAAVQKYVQVSLTRRSLWGWGLVGKTWVHLNSNATTDSWISDPDNNSATAAVAYTTGVRRDQGSVGCVSTSNGAVTLDSNADVYGTVNTGGGTVTTSSNVRIHQSASATTPKVDPSCVHTDFTYTFPSITVPTPATSNTISASITGNTTLPRTGDVINTADSKYYYSFASGKNINMDSNKTLTITDSVVLLFSNHTGVQTIHTSSNANFTVTSGKTVEVYTNGNIALDSNNSINVGNQAKNFLIYGTATTSQSFVLSSNVSIYGCIYAPNATYSIDSNCNLYGSVVANTIQMDSNAGFHYDESLANSGGSGSYRISKWKELQSATERASYATIFSGF